MLKKILRQVRGFGPLPLALAVGLTLASCTAVFVPQVAEVPPTAEPTPTPVPSGRGAGDTLRLLYWQAPTTLNPHLGQGVKDYDPSRITYEPLASYDKDGNLVPFLAAEIPSLENGQVAADGKSVTWKLKQGVQWSDGEPFGADDVLFTYEYITNPDVGSVSAGTYEVVESVEVIDDYTVKVNFKDVNAAWASPFVGIRGLILPRHIFEPYNGANAREAPANFEPVGTGPYRPLPPGIKPQEVLFLGNDLIQTVKIVYEPNPFFREADKPFFSRVEVKGGGTVKEAARAVLDAAEIDFAWNLQVDASFLAELEEEGKGETLVVFGADTERIQLNRTDPNKVTSEGERSSLEFPHPFFNDLKVRQALTYAIDREAIAALYGAAGRVATDNLVSPANFDSPNTSYEFNPDKACWMRPVGPTVTAMACATRTG
jgi:peptide/nickel transport system substrate-binding protein